MTSVCNTVEVSPAADGKGKAGNTEIRKCFCYFGRRLAKQNLWTFDGTKNRLPPTAAVWLRRVGHKIGYFCSYCFLTLW
jgi:hypothetical protein